MENNIPLSHIKTPAVIGTPIRIADNELNRSNNFYKDLIGHEGVIIDLEDDGLYDIALPTQPLLTGLKAERFVIIYGLKTTSTSKWHRFTLTLIVLGIISTVAGVAWLLTKFA